LGTLIPAKERVWVSSKSKSKYESLAGKGKSKKKKSKRFFKSQAALFDFCAAIGLRDGERVEIKNRVELKFHSWVTRMGARSIGDLNLINWMKLELESEGYATTLEPSKTPS
jgi:hypothetical protein